MVVVALEATFEGVSAREEVRGELDAGFSRPRSSSRLSLARFWGPFPSLNSQGFAGSSLQRSKALDDASALAEA